MRTLILVILFASLVFASPVQNEKPESWVQSIVIRLEFNKGIGINFYPTKGLSISTNIYLTFEDAKRLVHQINAELGVTNENR